jgi:hypothetical protein
MKSLAVFLFFGIAISAQVSTGSLYGRLRVGKASESVEVVAKGSLLQADDSTAGYLINSQMADALPLDGRNVMSLVTLGPGSIPRQRLSVKFRAEVFNSFNHPNLGIPGPYPDFGPLFWKILASGDPRRIQFSGRFDF